MVNADKQLLQFLERIAVRYRGTLKSAAYMLIHHEWGEVSGREDFYSELQSILLKDPLDISSLQDCIKTRGNWLVGGHASVRARVKSFLESSEAPGLISSLVSKAVACPDSEAIDTFVAAAASHGFQNQGGHPVNGDAAYFGSILLTAAFPDQFVEYRRERWKWAAQMLGLPPLPDGTHGQRICAVGKMARDIVATETFQQYFAGKHTLWTLAGIVWLIQKNTDFRDLTELEPDEVAELMQGIPPDEWDQTAIRAFGKFREDRAARFIVQIRRMRAEQLRELFSTPSAITLETFNREVWNIVTSANLAGTDVKSSLQPLAEITPEKLTELEEGLAKGQLELHGNMIWGSGTAVFGPMLQGGDEEKLRSVIQALTILNDEDLTPFDKANRIMELDGFGRNIATGLVMVFHPCDFAIWNKPSEGAVKKLGYEPKDLEGFQLVAQKIRRRVGASDFLELDYFLFLLFQNQLEYPTAQQTWWVCQGTMYQAERSGGYMFAPKETANGKSVQHHSNVALLKPGHRILHYANGALRAISQVLAQPQETSRPDKMPGETAGQVGWLVRVSYADLTTPIILAEIPEDLRTADEKPFTSTKKVKQGYLFPVSQAFYSRLQVLFANRFPTIKPKEIQNRRIVKIAPGEGAKYWDECLKNGYISIGWVDVGDLRKFATKEDFRVKFGEVYSSLYNNHEATISRKANEVWILSELRPGDLVIANRGTSQVLGVGTVLDPPYDFCPNPSRDDFGHLIHVSWDTSMAKPIPKQGFWALTTVADVPKDLYEYIVGPSVPATTIPQIKDHIEPSLDAVGIKIAEWGLKISERLLRRYHLSLKTRGFVILCGLSGSGKTWLAELYARAVGAECIVVPVAPNWTTNEDLLGYFNPIDNHYHDTAFSRFLRQAAEHYEDAQAAGVIARTFHLILDEMNLARVEYYFARFLSAMELRVHLTEATIELGPNDSVLLPPNLCFIGTVNVDETTHGFADKVYDRAQLIEITVDRTALRAHLGQAPYADTLMEIWDAVQNVAPFAFRVLDEVKSYIDHAATIGTSWEEALDEQLLQKVLTKVKGADQRTEDALEQFSEKTAGSLPLSYAKAKHMLELLRDHGITSYF